MAYLYFTEFPDLIQYYTTVGNGTLLKEEHTTIGNHTLLRNIDKSNVPYPTKFLGGHSQPNPQKLSTLLLAIILP